VRLVRSVALVIAGVLAGFAGAGQLLRRAFPLVGTPKAQVALTAINSGLELESHATAFR
jgi:hypothetical protein